MEIGTVIFLESPNSSNAGTIQEVSPGFFEVVGSHTYNNAGPYSQVTVYVTQDWRNAAIVVVGYMNVDAGTLPYLGPTVVPGNSVYTYFVPITGGSKIVNPKNPWAITAEPPAVGAPKILLSGVTIAPFTVNINGIHNTRWLPALYADIQFSNNAFVATISVKEFFGRLV